MTNVVPKIFLSYSTREVVLARLIAHIFEENGVKCFLAERDLSTGSQFDSEISKQIRQSNLLLVLWSSDSAQSSWVNQEVGIAAGLEVPVWPVAIEKIPIQGAIFRNQGIYLSGYEDPYTQIAKLAQEIKSTPSPIRNNFKPAIDQFIVGKVKRTEQIVELLKEEFPKIKTTGAYTLRIQAAFSCFAISNDLRYRVGSFHSQEYYDLLVKELESVKRVIKKGSLKAILWPRFPYEDRSMRVRFENLINFLETNKDYDRVRFVIGGYERGNRYILDSNVLVEGRKAPEAPGYALTTYSYHKPTILSAISSFDKRFDELWEDHAEACGVDPSRDAESIRLFIIKELRRLGGLG